MKWKRFGPGDYVSHRYRFKIEKIEDNNWHLIDMHRNWIVYKRDSLKECMKLADYIVVSERSPK